MSSHMQPVLPKQPMHAIDLRTELETVQAQLKQATTDDEVRRLNARIRILVAKLRKVGKRDDPSRGDRRIAKPTPAVQL